MAKLNLRLSFSPLHVLSNLLFSHVLVWSFIAVLYCHMFSSRGTDLVDFRPWLSQQHCLQSWFRPGSIVQSGPPRPIERGVCRQWFLFAGDYIRSMEKTLWWRNSVNCCCCVWQGEVTFHPCATSPLYRLYRFIYWNCLSGNSCFILGKKKLHPDKEHILFCRSCF